MDLAEARKVSVVKHELFVIIGRDDSTAGLFEFSSLPSERDGPDEGSRAEGLAAAAADDSVRRLLAPYFLKST
jgi:hypothetical protein